MVTVLKRNGIKADLLLEHRCLLTCVDFAFDEGLRNGFFDRPVRAFLCREILILPLRSGELGEQAHKYQTQDKQPRGRQREVNHAEAEHEHQTRGNDRFLHRSQCFGREHFALQGAIQFGGVFRKQRSNLVLSRHRLHRLERLQCIGQSVDQVPHQDGLLVARLSRRAHEWRKKHHADDRRNESSDHRFPRNQKRNHRIEEAIDQ